MGKQLVRNKILEEDRGRLKGLHMKYQREGKVIMKNAAYKIFFSMSLSWLKLEKKSTVKLLSIWKIRGKFASIKITVSPLIQMFGNNLLH